MFNTEEQGTQSFTEKRFFVIFIISNAKTAVKYQYYPANSHPVYDCYYYNPVRGCTISYHHRAYRCYKIK